MLVVRSVWVTWWGNYSHFGAVDEYNLHLFFLMFGVFYSTVCCIVT